MMQVADIFPEIGMRRDPYADMLMPQDRGSLFGSSLMQAGLGMLADNYAGRNKRGAAPYIQQGFQNYQGGMQDLMRNRMAQQQMGMQQRGLDMRKAQHDFQMDQAKAASEESERQRQAIEGMIANLPPEQQALARANPEAFTKQWSEQMFSTAKPTVPTVRNFNEGDEVVTKQWDPTTNQWTETARGPRSSPKDGGGLTTAQERTNQKIQSARKWLRDTGLGPDELRQKLGSNTDLLQWLDQQDPIVRQRWGDASQPLFGGDSEYDGVWSQFAPPEGPGVSGLPATPSPQGADPSMPTQPADPGLLGPARPFAEQIGLLDPQPPVRAATQPGAPMPAMPQQPGSIARPTSEADFQALPAGALFYAPDGSVRRKPDVQRRSPPNLYDPLLVE